ncbi:MAG TPA: hypothetical protein VM939_14760, partial [Gemmatimonadaceae bacterium]|nr:hypothetical protein [Gemmatimonadaceae bacterium]
PGKIVTFVMPPGSSCNGSTCKVTVVGIIGFSMDKVVLNGNTDAQITGHLIPLVSSGSISDIDTGIYRPILVK